MLVPALKYAGGTSDDFKTIVITFPGVAGVPKVPCAPGPAETRSQLFELCVSRYGVFCTIDRTVPPDDVVAKDGGTAGPLLEMRSRFVPVHCRGMSVPCRRSESAMYSVFWKVTDF